MLEFSDLTPLGPEEHIKYGDLSWYRIMTFTSSAPAGFQVLSECADLWNALVCNKEIKCRPGALQDDWGKDYSEVVCLLRKYHVGKCVCWVPTKGIISHV